MNEYQPTIAQALYGQPTEQFELPPFVLSMFDGLMRECQRVHWNVFQKDWEDYDDADLGAVHLRHYSWTHADGEDAGPNFWADSDPQRLRWYKHPGRGMSCALYYTPGQWIDWHDAVLAGLHAFEDAHE